MVGYAAGSTGAPQPGEDQQIIEYLSATQTPEAVAQRRAQADKAASAGQSLIALNAPPLPAPPAGSSEYERTTLGFVSARLPGRSGACDPPAARPRSASGQGRAPGQSTGRYSTHARPVVPSSFNWCR